MNAIERIKAHYNDLSKVQKRIADFLVKNPEKACFYSLKELSLAANITEVTLIKFTKKIGYKNFIDLKKDLQYFIQCKISPNKKLLNAVRDISSEDFDDNLKEILNVEIEALNRTLNSVNADDLTRAIHLIKNANRIFLVGQTVSETVVKYLLIRLRILGLDAIELNTSHYSSISAQLINLNPTDIFIIISFPHYGKRTVGVSRYLKDKDIKYIALTDRMTSPVANDAEVVFPCATDSLLFYNSMTSPIAVANILVSSIAISLKDVLTDNKKKAKDIEKFLRDK